MDNITVSMDVLIHEEINGNYFTFTFGQDEKKYFFLKLDGGGGKIAVTKGSYSNESVAYGSGDFVGKWINVKIDITPSTIKFYADGVLIGENNNVNTTVTEIGKNLSCYLGKSYYESDLYCKAYYDNIKIYYNGLEAAK